LADVRAGKINTVVVYKVDRVTRSLADFAKLVELFDQYGVLSLSEIKSERTDGVIRRELVLEECARMPEQPVISVHPYSGKGVFSRHCNTPLYKRSMWCRRRSPKTTT
jgi:hypothetical protein